MGSEDGSVQDQVAVYYSCLGSSNIGPKPKSLGRVIILNVIAFSLIVLFSFLA